MCEKVGMAVILILNFNNRINPCCSLISLVIVAAVVEAHVGKTRNNTDCK